MRRYDIDALRVIVFGLLIFYHVGMFFVPWDYHIKNAVIYEWLELPMLFLNQWRLPLLFVISGMGTYFNISKRNGGGFAKERFVRLFIPLVVGMLLIVPPQIYFERLDAGQFMGGYFDFWPSKSFVGGSYPEGNISWHHLWFLPYLLIFSLILIPVFVYLRNHPQAWMIVKMKQLSASKFGLFMLAVPLIIWEIVLKPVFPSTHALLDDWYNFVNYLTLFFYGFLLMTFQDVLWVNISKNRRIYLITGIITFVLLILIWVCIENSLFDPALEKSISGMMRAINEWTWILALIGYAATYLNKPSKSLKYANEAVYPFYILHQTVIIALGYYLKNTEMYLTIKFLIMIIGTFGISWLIYEFGIRRFAWIRPLFGMKRQ
ncbi:MAG: acyltransferase family protein [Tannerella sp.]|jgi:hypothetical protein|nr:acyltransferase family protein [Tannerella sp.]